MQGVRWLGFTSDVLSPWSAVTIVSILHNHGVRKSAGDVPKRVLGGLFLRVVWTRLLSLCENPDMDGWSFHCVLVRLQSLCSPMGSEVCGFSSPKSGRSWRNTFPFLEGIHGFPSLLHSVDCCSKCSRIRSRRLLPQYGFSYARPVKCRAPPNTFDR